MIRHISTPILMDQFRTQMALVEVPSNTVVIERYRESRESRERKKVQRWKNAIQQYNFVCEHIPGPDNIVADHYSRLNSLNTSTESIDSPKTSISATLASMTSDIPFVTELHAYRSTPEPSPGRAQAFLAAKRARLKPATSVIATPITLDRHEILKTVHNITSGHSGTERTLDRLRAKGHKWPGMRQDVITFVKQCPPCQMMRESRIKILVKPFHLSVFNPMERLNIDTIGPLPPDEEGNEHILVIIDVFSRFVEFVSMWVHKGVNRSRFAWSG